MISAASVHGDFCFPLDRGGRRGCLMGEQIASLVAKED